MIKIRLEITSHSKMKNVVLYEIYSVKIEGDEYLCPLTVVQTNKDIIKMCVVDLNYICKSECHPLPNNTKSNEKGSLVFPMTANWTHVPSVTFHRNHISAWPM